ncbi:hypothetical protein MNBD_GAMMA03-908, partial [hydrothermal vent metagenome]
ALPEALSSAQSITVDATGRVWFTEKIGNKLAVFDPKNNKFEIFPLPSSWGDLGFSKVVTGPRGDIWFTLRRGAANEKEPNMIGRFTPEDGYFTKYSLSIDSIPEDIFIGPDGVIWFLAANRNNLYRVDPVSFKVKGYPLPSENASPRGITADAKGHIWFSEVNTNKIGKFIPEDEVFYEYAIPSSFSSPGKIAIDKDGRVWFVETTTNRLGVFYPDLLRFDEALIPTPKSSPSSIAADKDGNIWFLQYRGNKVGVFKPKAAVFYEYDIPTYSSLPGEMVIDPERSVLWFTQSNTEAKSLGTLSLTDALLRGDGKELSAREASSKRILTVDEPSSNFFNWFIFSLIVVVIFIGWGWLKYSRSVRNS